MRAIAYIDGYNLYYGCLKGTPYKPYKIPLTLDVEKIKVWRPEEKQTDVKIALNMYRDAVQDSCETMLLFSNDSDLAPAIDFVKQHNSGIDVGIVVPRRESSDRNKRRSPAGSLAKSADWMRNIIRSEELRDAQMNNMIPTRKKPAFKPEYW